jgi:chemotaxis protein CheC
MKLATSQVENLTELINIGYDRAAGALSELTGYRVTLEVPRIALHSTDEIASVLNRLVKGRIVSVHQVFSGPISGTALLILDDNAARVLSGLLTDEETAAGDFDAPTREIITQTGNVLLNASLGVFGNLHHVQVSFAVPRLRLNTVDQVFQSMGPGHEGLTYALMIHTGFHLRASTVAGYMVMILDDVSLERVLVELEKWEQRQQR